MNLEKEKIIKYDKININGRVIMNVKIGNLTITSFCEENVEHIRFRKDLKNDDPIYDFVSVDIEKELHEVENQKEVEIGNSYIIKDRNQLIGYVYFLSINDSLDIVELRYAVHPEFRRLGYIGYSDSNRKGYGEQILEECSSYLFNRDNINGIELHIRKDNEASIGCAKKAKYECVGENNDEYYYIYRKLKNNPSI